MRRALIDCSNHASSVLHADSHTVISSLDISMIERIEKYAEEISVRNDNEIDIESMSVPSFLTGMCVLFWRRM